MKYALIFSIMVFSSVYAQEAEKSKNVNLTLSDPNAGVQKKYVDIGDAYFYYEVAGKGTAVILINWEPNEPLFFEIAKKHLTVRYDLRGYGKTDKPLAGEKFTHAEDLNKLMWFLGIQKAHLIGRGTGALVGIDFQSLYPKQIISLSLVDINNPAVKDADINALLYSKNTYISKLPKNANSIDSNGIGRLSDFINSIDND
jgi:pimeloyl-ACP methyl ester carboxylesterase